MVAPARRPRGRKKPTIAPRPRKPGGGNITGKRKPPLRRPGGTIGPGKPGRPPRKPGGPGGIGTGRGGGLGGVKGERDPRPTRPGRGGGPDKWKPAKPGGIKRAKPGGISAGRGKVGKPRRMKKRVMY